jgi:hypothetical protein
MIIEIITLDLPQPRAAPRIAPLSAESVAQRLSPANMLPCATWRLSVFVSCARTPVR